MNDPVLDMLNLIAEMTNALIGAVLPMGILAERLARDLSARDDSWHEVHIRIVQSQKKLLETVEKAVLIHASEKADLAEARNAKMKRTAI